MNIKTEMRIFKAIFVLFALLFWGVTNTSVYADSDEEYIKLNEKIILLNGYSNNNSYFFIPDESGSYEFKLEGVTTKISSNNFFLSEYDSDGFSKSIYSGSFDTSYKGTESSAPYNYDFESEMHFYLRKGYRYNISCQIFNNKIDNEITFCINNSDVAGVYNGLVYTRIKKSYDGENYIEGLTIYDFVGDEKNIIIPSEIDGYPVIKIEDYVFSGSDIETLKLNEGLREVGEWIACNCNKLQWVSFPSSLVECKYYLFCGCANLQTIDFPNGNICYSLIDDALIWSNNYGENVICGIIGTDKNIYTIPSFVNAFPLDIFNYSNTEILYLSRVRYLNRIYNSSSSLRIKEYHFAGPDCSFENGGIPDYYDEDTGFNKPTVYAPADGTIEAYCKDNDIPFVIEGEFNPEIPKPVSEPIDGIIGKWNNLIFDTWDGANYQQINFKPEADGLYCLNIELSRIEYSEELNNLGEFPVSGMFNYSFVDSINNTISPLDESQYNDHVEPGFTYVLEGGKTYTFWIKVKDDYKHVGLITHMGINLSYESNIDANYHGIINKDSSLLLKNAYSFIPKISGKYSLVFDQLSNSELSFNVYEVNDSSYELINAEIDDGKIIFELSKDQKYVFTNNYKSKESSVYVNYIYEIEFDFVKGNGTSYGINFYTDIGCFENGTQYYSSDCYGDTELTDIPEVILEDSKYRFVGWKIVYDSNNTIYYNSLSESSADYVDKDGYISLNEYIPTSNVNFIAQYESDDYYLVTFSNNEQRWIEYNSTVSISYDVPKGDKIGNDIIPEFEPDTSDEEIDYFSWYLNLEDGWNNEKKIAKDKLSNYVPDQNISLTVDWRIIYTLRFIVENGSFSEGNKETIMKVPEWYAFHLSSDPEREGYIFVGWKSDRTGNIIMGNSEDVNSNKNSYEELIGKKLYSSYDIFVSYNDIYRAVWNKKNTIIFKSDEGYINGTSDTKEYIIDVTEGFTLQRFVPSFSRPDYNCAGLIKESTGKIYTLDEVKNTIPNEDEVYNIVWKKAIKITWKSNGGNMYYHDFSYNNLSQNKNEGDKIGDTPDRVYRDGYEFIGWSLNDDKLYSSEEIANMVVNSEMIITAQWRKLSDPTPSPTHIIETTASPTSKPTEKPTVVPTIVPTEKPKDVPSAVPTSTPNKETSAKPSSEPAQIPTDKPTTAPDSKPTENGTPTATPKASSAPVVAKDKTTSFNVKNKATVKTSAKIKVKDKDKIKKITLNGKTIKIKKNKTSFTLKLKSYKKKLKKKGKWNTLKVTDNKGNTKTIKFKTK